MATVIKGIRDTDYDYGGEGVAHPSSGGWSGYDRIDIEAEYGEESWRHSDAPIWVQVPEGKLSAVLAALED